MVKFIVPHKETRHRFRVGYSALNGAMLGSLAGFGLAARGVVKKGRGQTKRLTALGESLDKNVPGSIKSMRRAPKGFMKNIKLTWQAGKAIVKSVPHARRNMLIGGVAGGLIGGAGRHYLRRMIEKRDRS